MSEAIGIDEQKRDPVMLRRDLFDKYDPERRIQSRLFCCGSGGSDSGGGGNDDSPDPVTNPTVERGRGAEPPAATGRNFSQGSNNQSNRDDNTPRETMLDIVTLGDPVSNRIPNQISQRDELEIQNFVEQLAAAPIAPITQQQAPFTATGPILPPDFVTDLGGETFDTRTGNLVQTGFVEGMDGPDVILPPTQSVGFVEGMDGPDPTTRLVFEDEYDPFAGTGQTAMETIGYDLDDQSGPDGRVRPFAGLTREQQADLEARDDLVSRGILAAQTEQPSGIPTTNLTGIYTFGNDPNAMVRGFSDFGPTLPLLGPTQVYTGFGDNPFEALSGTENEGGTDLQPPVSNPLTGTSKCPDGFIFDDDLQACRRKTRSELAETGSGGSPAPPGDIFYRRSILDDAPANLPAGFDFDAANRRFIQSYGVRPDNYRMPLSLTGFTKL